MVSGLDSGSRGPGSGSGWVHRVVLFIFTVPSLHPGV